jgi:hypothetical protein
MGATALAPVRADALMVGEPPDSPRARLDANRADSIWSGVASLFIDGSVYSAVLVGARFALTAAHVLRDGSSITLNLNLDGDLTHQIAVARALRHPAFRGLGHPPPIHDLALLELAAEVPAIARRYPVSANAPAAGTEIELVGYGASGRGSRGVEVPQNAALKRHGRARLLRLPASDAAGAWMFMFDYSAPVDARIDRPTGLAPGDSGSGAFVRIDGEPVLAGINTLTMRPAGTIGPPFGYGTRGAGQLLSPQWQWLHEASAGAVTRR